MDELLSRLIGRCRSINEGIHRIHSAVREWASANGRLYDLDSSDSSKLEEFTKDWLLSDGSVILCYDHDDIATALGGRVEGVGDSKYISMLLNTGAARLYWMTGIEGTNQELDVEFRKPLSPAQIDSLIVLFEMAGVITFDFGSEDMPSFSVDRNDSDEVRRFLRMKSSVIR